MKQGQKVKARRRITIESFGILLILITPFIFKSYEYFPDTEGPVTFLWFQIDGNGFNEISTYVWFVLGKIIPLYLLIFWFLTCKHWWYHIILIPICMYAFQIFEAMYSLDLAIDTKNALWILPVCMIVIPFVYFIRLKLFDKYVHGIDMEALAAELEYYKNKEQAELDKAGIKVPKFTQETFTEDFSNKTPKQTLNQIMKHLQQTMKSLLSL